MNYLEYKCENTVCSPFGLCFLLGLLGNLLLPAFLSAQIAWPDVVFTLNNAAVTPEGYLDVTKSPYNLDNDGGSAASNRASLQDAIDDAFNHNLAVFFPPGTYDVDNKLELFQVEHHMTFCHVLVGSAVGARPLIRVTGNNFYNAGNPKPVFHYYCSPNGTGPPSADRAAAGYNMVFRGIDIDLGGKAGAIGVEMHAAQGSTIQDVKIIATGAFAGIESLCGSGTTHANIEIIGGRYGFYVSSNRPVPVLTGITCIGQTVRAIHFPSNMAGPLTVVGFRIEAATGPVFIQNGNRDDEHLCLIDGSIEITGAKTTVIKNQNRSVYLRNVYVKKANKVVDNVQGVDLQDNSGNWTYIGDYNYFHIANRQLIDRSFSNGEHKRNVLLGTASPPPSDLISRHLWDESAFPHFEDGNCIFVGPDDDPDDSAAIQAAIDSANGKTVFLKKGDYYLKRNLVLKGDSKILGVSRNLTRIHCHSSWTENSYTPMIETPNSVNATCLIAWFALQTPYDQDDNITFLDWTAGRHSMVREVHFMKEGNWNGGQGPMKRIQISGTGGGRWYSVFTRAAAEQGEDPNFRQVYITGTSEPLSIYAHTVEYTEPETYMTEINNSSNVSFYGFKVETDIGGQDDGGQANKDNPAYFKHTPALGIVDSQNIIVLSEGGLGELDDGESDRGLIEIVGTESNHIQLANITGGWRDNTGWGIVRDMVSDQVILKNAANGPGDPVALYSLGNPAPIPYDPSTSASGTTNILVNGDFESGDLSDYTGTGTIITGANAYSGTYSGELVTDGSWKTIEQIQPVSPNTVYTVSGYVFASGIGSSGKKARYLVRFLDSDNNPVGDGNDNIAIIYTDAPWKRYGAVMTSPVDAAKMRLRVISESIPSGGFVRADELVATDIAPPIYENNGLGCLPSDDFIQINESHLDEFTYTNEKLDAIPSWKRIQLTAANAATWDDYTVSVYVENITTGTSPKNVATVLVRCVGGENYYGVLIDKDDKLFVGKKSSGNWVWGTGVATTASHTAYSLRLVVSGSSPTSISVFINGDLTAAMNYTDSTSPHIMGGIGFEVRNNHAAWDNIVVRE